MLLSTKIPSYKKEINQLSILNKEKRISEMFTELNLYNKHQTVSKAEVVMAAADTKTEKTISMLANLYGKSTKIMEQPKKKIHKSKRHLVITCKKSFYSRFPFALFCKFWFFTHSIKRLVNKMNSNKVKARGPVFGSSASGKQVIRMKSSFKLDLLKLLLNKKSLKPILKAGSFKSFNHNLYLYFMFSLIRFNQFATLSRNNHLISVELPNKNKQKEAGVGSVKKSSFNKKNVSSLNFLNIMYSYSQKMALRVPQVALQPLHSQKKSSKETSKSIISSFLLKKPTYFLANQKMDKKQSRVYSKPDNNRINLNFHPDFRITKELLYCTIHFPAKKNYLPIHVTVNKVGHKLGEFYPTRTNVKFNQLYKGKSKEQPRRR